MLRVELVRGILLPRTPEKKEKKKVRSIIFQELDWMQKKKGCFTQTLLVPMLRRISPNYAVKPNREMKNCDVFSGLAEAPLSNCNRWIMQWDLYQSTLRPCFVEGHHDFQQRMVTGLRVQINFVLTYVEK